MNASEFIARARKALNKGVPYNQRNRTFDPRTNAPPGGGLDCGTFVRWAVMPDPPMNQSREPAWDTTSIFADATGAQEFFQKIAVPRPGCLIVYPDYKAVAQVTRDETKHDGHVAIVTETGTVEIDTPTGIKTFFGATRVIHCSRVIEGLRAELVPGAGRDSIAETNALVFYTFVPIYASVWRITPDPVQTANEP